MGRLVAALLFAALVAGALALTAVDGDEHESEATVPALTDTRMEPGAVLLDRQGRERQRWTGAFDPNLALEAAEPL